jgi:Arc/MetJ family transcription regulator
MRTTLNIPEELIEEARQILGIRSKTDTVILSLKELVRSRRVLELKEMFGTIRLEIDIPCSRRRRSKR